MYLHLNDNYTIIRWVIIFILKQECIPVGCVPPTLYRTWGGLPGQRSPLDRNPLGQRSPEQGPPRDQQARQEVTSYRDPSVNRITHAPKNITLPQNPFYDSLFKCKSLCYIRCRQAIYTGRGVAPEVNLREYISRMPPQSSNKAEPTMALKPSGDVTRSLNRGISHPKNGHVSNKNFKKIHITKLRMVGFSRF